MDTPHNLLTEHLRHQRDHAARAAETARRNLIRLLDEAHIDLAAAIADVATLQPYATWWAGVIDHIDQAGLDPITALTQVRAAAHRALTERPTPTGGHPFALGQAVAAVEAARRFYHATARIDLNTITGIDTTTPALTTREEEPASTTRRS